MARHIDYKENPELWHEYWDGFHEVRSKVWAMCPPHATQEQYMEIADRLAAEYDAEWDRKHANENENQPAEEVEEVVTPTPSVTEVSTTMEPAELEAPEIEENGTPSNSPFMGRTDEQRPQSENTLPLEGEGRAEGLSSATWFKIIICLASIIAALCVGGWVMPFVCILPFFCVFAYEHDKMERALVVQDSPALYQYGTRSE